MAELAARLESRRLGYAWTPVLAPAEQKQVWNLRKAGLGLLMGMKGDAKPQHEEEKPLDTLASG